MKNHMSGKMKLVLMSAGLVLVLAVVVGSAFYFMKGREVSREGTSSTGVGTESADGTEDVGSKSDSPTSAPSTIIRTAEKSFICKRKGIENLKPIEADKKYVTRIPGAEQNDGAYYNDYLFCTSFLDGRKGVPTEDYVEGSDSISQRSMANKWFAEFSVWNDIFGSSDCGSHEVDISVNRFKQLLLSQDGNAAAQGGFQNTFQDGFRTNLANISSADMCGFFKRVPETLFRLRAADFCSGNFECQALMDDDTSLCDRMDFGIDSDKAACRDNVWYQRALKSGDVKKCTNMETSYKNIACQAYFLGKYTDMCNGLINDINEKFCK